MSGAHVIQGRTPEHRIRSEWVQDGDCWRWTGPLSNTGYGYVSLYKGSIFAHRLSYEYWVGPIPEGLEIDHVKARGCRFTDCINPAHLEPVTHAENVRRAMRDDCANGHPFTAESTGYWGGARVCKICKREQARERRRTRRLDADDPRHGVYSTYSNYTCRCEPCGRAYAAWRTALRERKAAAA